MRLKDKTENLDYCETKRFLEKERISIMKIIPMR